MLIMTSRTRNFPNGSTIITDASPDISTKIFPEVDIIHHQEHQLRGLMMIMVREVEELQVATRVETRSYCGKIWYMCP